MFALRGKSSIEVVSICNAIPLKRSIAGNTRVSFVIESEIVPCADATEQTRQSDKKNRRAIIRKVPSFRQPNQRQWCYK
jgi:hypothetical protein